MWNTTLGDRVLTGAESRLFREALTDLVEELNTGTEIEEPYAVGVPLFDDLSTAQKLAMLEAVSLALLREDVPPPQQNVMTDAVIAAVFAQLGQSVEAELGDARMGTDIGEFSHHSRRLVLDALRERDAEELPDENSDDPYDWQAAIEDVKSWIIDDDQDWAEVELLAATRAAAILGVADPSPYWVWRVPLDAEISVEAIKRTFGRRVRELNAEGGVAKVVRG